MIFIGKVAVLGAGLLGASFARAIKAKGIAREVAVWSRSETTRKKCAALPEIFDSVFESPQEAVAGADIVVVCAPTKNIPQLVENIAKSLKSGAIVTDVGSVKSSICKRCSDALSGSGAVFIGSHPMAGSEKIGMDFSDASLFDGRPCFVTPIDESQMCQSKLIGRIWNEIGMKTHFVSPDLHDAIVARVSHLPHLLAGTLCYNASHFKDADLRMFSGPGFRDTTRVASGSPEMWDSIVADNRDEIISALKSYVHDLNALVSYIENGDAEAVGKRLRTAKEYRDKL